MSQFKPGDLAILKSSGYEHLAGCVVELVAYVSDAPSYVRDGIRYQNPVEDRIWWVRLVHGQTYATPLRGDVSDGPCGARRLIPLRGDFAPERQKSRELTT